MKKNSQSHMLLRAVMVGVMCSTSHMAWAQSAKELDLEIYIVDEDATPAEVINRITLPTPASAEVAPPIMGETPLLDDSVRQLEKTADSTLDSATRTVTETINDAISSGDLTKLPPEVDALVPDEVIDKIIDNTGVELDLPIDIGTKADGSLDSLPNTLPNLPLQIDDIDSAIKDLESSVNTPEINLPELDRSIESLQSPNLPGNEINVDTTTEDALDALKNSADDAVPAEGQLIPGLLN